MCGANFPPSFIDQITIVIASYSTCLGVRPFPTEMSDLEAKHFFENCNEIDVAEFKKRRIGWLDIPSLKKALVGSNGAQIHMNKLDVLSGLSELKICTHYEIDGQPTMMLPDDPHSYHKIIPHYQTVAGWSESLEDVRTFAELPEKARQYVMWVSELLGHRIDSIGVGPKNSEFISVG